MKAYSNWQSPLWKDETKRVKHFDIPLYGRFDVISPVAVNGLWQVEYISNGKTFTGYIEDRFMEWYENKLRINVVDIEAIQTPELNDAQQYIFWDGFKRSNMCGELCVAETLGIPLVDILIKWQTVDPPFYKRIVPWARKDTGTIHDDIIKIYGLFGQTAQRITLAKYTPRIFADLVKLRKGVTVSTHLNTQTGSLNGSGVLHWVNVKDVIVNGMDAGWVIVYNPYVNGDQLISWRELLATTRSPYGVLA